MSNLVISVDGTAVEILASKFLVITEIKTNALRGEFFHATGTPYTGTAMCRERISVAPLCRVHTTDACSLHAACMHPYCEPGITAINEIWIISRVASQPHLLLSSNSS